MKTIDIPKTVLQSFNKALIAHKKFKQSEKNLRHSRTVAISIARKYGLSVREIGKYLNLTGQRIGYLMKKAGIE